MRAQNIPSETLRKTYDYKKLQKLTVSVHPYAPSTSLTCSVYYCRTIESIMITEGDSLKNASLETLPCYNIHNDTLTCDIFGVESTINSIRNQPVKRKDMLEHTMKVCVCNGGGGTGLAHNSYPSHQIMVSVSSLGIFSYQVQQFITICWWYTWRFFLVFKHNSSGMDQNWEITGCLGSFNV